MLGGDSVAVVDWSILMRHCQKKFAITELETNPCVASILVSLCAHTKFFCDSRQKNHCIQLQASPSGQQGSRMKVIVLIEHRKRLSFNARPLFPQNKAQLANR